MMLEGRTKKKGSPGRVNSEMIGLSVHNIDCTVIRTQIDYTHSDYLKVGAQQHYEVPDAVYLFAHNILYTSCFPRSSPLLYSMEGKTKVRAAVEKVPKSSVKYKLATKKSKKFADKSFMELAVNTINEELEQKIQQNLEKEVCYP